MKKCVLLVFTLGVSCIIWAQSSATLPFTIVASEDVASDFPGAPRLQSFSFAQWKGRWVFIGGRISGYHAVGGGSAEFLRADANRDVWVVDTNVRPARTYHVSVSQLPGRFAALQAQWTSTGQLYFQDGDNLYICGGYGQDEHGHWSTFDIVSRVSLPALTDAVIQGKLPAEGIAFTRSPLVQSTGGGLMKLADGYFYVVMGHSFQGSYTAFEGRGEQNGSEASQTYLNEIRKLRIGDNPDGSLSVAVVETYRDETEFHRRDLNVAQFLSPAGLGFAVYGGVFTPETQLSYGKPIYLNAGAHPSLDSMFEQKMNAYTCAVLLMYSESREAMYTTFFGGISRFVWNSTKYAYEENSRVGSKTDLTYLDGLQWSDQISTIQRSKRESIEVVHPESLPGFIGTDAVFIPNPELARAQPGTDIVAYDSLPKTRTLVGYIYGGIRAYPFRFPYLKTSAPYNSGAVPTKASDVILKVYLQR
jgi:hypothetical protein